MGKAEDWQSKVEHYFEALEDYTVLNPRRDDWDSSWVQEFESPNFFSASELRIEWFGESG